MSTREAPAYGDWMALGACKSADPGLFFSGSRIGRGSTPRFDPTAAKAICGTCSVRTRCLNWALEFRVDDGVWGGLTPDERMALR